MEESGAVPSDGASWNSIDEEVLREMQGRGDVDEAHEGEGQDPVHYQL
jgi:hypothetical protein